MIRNDEQGLDVTADLTIPASEIVEAASRSSGPGGQHVNKANTRVTLRWNIRRSRVLSDEDRHHLLLELRVRLTSEGDLIVNADRSRSRARNREQARLRIVELLRTALTRKASRRPTRPSNASKKRVKNAKASRSVLKRSRGRVSREDD